jgi:DNA invertase Pin-like site-specific DNA recombinase
MQIVGYARVSTAEQGLSRAGIEAQRAVITAEAERRGWEVVWIEDVASGRDLARPGAECALRMLRRKEAGALVVAKLDRWSRSLPDFAATMQRAKRERWAFVALDLGVDTTTATGRLVANVMASVADWEREMIGQRTAEALAVKKSQGVRLGRPRTMSRKVTQRVLELRAQGLSLAGVAAALNDEGVPTQRGGQRWYGSTVQGVLDSARLDGLVA